MKRQAIQIERDRAVKTGWSANIATSVGRGGHLDVQKFHASKTVKTNGGRIVEISADFHGKGSVDAAGLVTIRTKGGRVLSSAPIRNRKALAAALAAAY
ncbi:hypothetical protein SEA_BANTAM_170 [Gordonia phage Bantam]|uniref:Uncharacterized protein n=1 Tax=Gordonia phage Bantam TaxID=1887641 RepID=A0A1B3AYL9_9CAUD|nr:hypothetical protein BIZ77_gp009 [Gordonia phage Bantam]AOE43859.1 hypothetical protein SEA_BANTAM_170 [Gordonia phage Bantam]